MITEQAIVTRCDGDMIEVRLERQTVCDRCELGQGCGTGALGRLLGGRNRPLLLQNRQRLQPGDRLRLRLSEAALVRISLAVYGLPLLGALAAGVAAALAGLGEPAVVAFCAAGFYAGFRFAARWAKRLETERIAPYIVDITLNPAASAQSQPQIQSTGIR